MTALRSAHFAITESRQGAAAVMELHGELDLAAAARLVAEFDKLLAADPAVVIVDLRDVSFIDARGTRALIGLRTSCQHEGRRVVLVRGQRSVHRMLVLCNLAQAFEFVDSAAEALELTDTAHGSRSDSDREVRSPGNLDAAADRRLTVAVTRDVATGRMRPRCDRKGDSGPFVPSRHLRESTAQEQLLTRRATRRSLGLE